MINAEKHYIIPDQVPKVGGVTVGLGASGTQNYLTASNAATVTGELRFDGSANAYKFVSDLPVNRRHQEVTNLQKR